MLSQSRAFSHLYTSTLVNKRALIGRFTNENGEMPLFNFQTGLTLIEVFCLPVIVLSTRSEDDNLFSSAEALERFLSDSHHGWRHN